MAGSRRQVEVQRASRYHPGRGAADRDQARSGNRRAPSYRAVAEAGADDQAGPEGVAPRLGGADRGPYPAAPTASPPNTFGREVGLCTSSIPTWSRSCVAPVHMVLSWIGSRMCRRSDSSCPPLRLERYRQGSRSPVSRMRLRRRSWKPWLDKVPGFLRGTADGRARLPRVGAAHTRRSDTIIEDAMIAATAAMRRLTVVTRNVSDLSQFGVELHSPFARG